jgi:hypothetical protein
MAEASPVATVRRRCSPEARAWLDRALAGIVAPLEVAAFQVAYAGASRRVGREVVVLDSDEKKGLGSPDAPVLDGRPLDEVARTALLLHALDCLPPAEHAAFVDEVYRRGDSREQAAVLRTLALLPEPARFLATAVEACRTNVRVVFEAIACGNPYPAAHFPDLAFNQMVLKALFVELPLASVVGLRARLTPELRRMADDYARERRAAGRPVPDDITILTEARGSAA